MFESPSKGWLRILAAGVLKGKRAALNFTGAGVTVTDNPSNNRVDVAISGSGGTPGLHATTHKHGGTDEVATATAAANAIPKAGAGGTLAAGWLPALGQVAQGGNNPAGTVSTAAAVMMGLGILYTPAHTGTLLIMMAGNLENNTAGDGVVVRIHTGTGAAPANGAALTGTARGNTAEYTQVVAAAKRVPFCCQALATGFAVGTQIWIDLECKAITGGTAKPSDVNVVVLEL